MKKYLIMIVFCILLTSCTSESKLRVGVLDEFIETLEEDFDYIDEVKATKTQGHINIIIHFTSTSESQTYESIYDELKSFFLVTDNQEKILKKYYGLKDTDGIDYPIIFVKMIDSNDTMSHFVQSPVNHVYYYKDSPNVNRYATWSDPQFDNELDE